MEKPGIWAITDLWVTKVCVPDPGLCTGLIRFYLYSIKCLYYCDWEAAAAAAKLLQSCLTLCDPIDGSLRGSSVHGMLQARTLEWVAIAFSIFYHENNVISLGYGQEDMPTWS